MPRVRGLALLRFYATLPAPPKDVSGRVRRDRDMKLETADRAKESLQSRQFSSTRKVV